MHHIHWLDLLVVVCYIGAVLGIGIRMARRQTDTEQYFVAKRSIPAWAMGMSMFATLITSISFIAYPGNAYAGNWAELVAGFMALGALVVVGLVVVPFFRHAVGMSAYEYFERRLGYSMRVYASFIFALGHLLKMGFIFYLVSLTIQSITGWNIFAVIAGVGIVTVCYTYVGGLEAVIWADVVQGFILWAGIFGILGRLLLFTPGGPGAILHYAWASHKINFGSGDFDFTQKGVLVMLFYGFFFYLQKYTADQTIVQRYLVAKTDREAIRGVALGASLCIPVWALFLLIGTLTWSYYRITGEPLPATLTKTDEVFPYFLATHIPSGLFGIILASLFSSAMGGISSDLNCLAVVGVEDYYRKLRPNAPDRQRLAMGKVFVALAGFTCVLIAITIAHASGAALPLYFTVTSVFAGGLFGLFFLAFMSTRVNTTCAWIGVAASLLFSLYATLTSGKDHLLELGTWDFAWHSVMIGTIGHVVVIVVGYAASYFVKNRGTVDRRMTLWGWLEHRRNQVAL